MLYHRALTPAQLEASERLAPEPAKPLGTPLALSDERIGRVPRHYIECSDDRALLPIRQRAMRAAPPCASVTTLDSDHSPFLCCPADLVDALDLIAA